MGVVLAVDRRGVAIKMAGRLNSGNEGEWLAAHSALQLPLKRIKISLYAS
jgi:hypothetical protein